jgi:hypothetical protein
MPYKNKEKQRQCQRIWLQQRRDSFFCDKKCVICNSKKDLQLDHKNPETKISHKIWSWAEDRRSKELERCQVLCKECHKEKTRLEMYFNLYVEHRAHNINKVGIYRKINHKNGNIKYEARFEFKNRKYWAGYFDTIEEAASARKEKIKEVIKDSPFSFMIK